MRFDDLFADLADQAGASGARELWDEAQELARAEVAGRSLAQRLGPGHGVRLELQGGSRVRGAVVGSGQEWCAVRADGELWMVQVKAIMRAALPATARPGQAGGVHAGVEQTEGGNWVTGAGRESRPDLPLRRLLRSLARSRAVVRIEGVDGHRVAGRLLAVGSDYVELATEAGSLAVMLHGAAAVITPE
ncbi:hypothetical protein [Galactobacter caseinivorans]|uniref:Fis family transcriptional regulator n=1 Tax=Galactobacter caseinivorans TaxID=2676123 RepID=A0A496PMG0_9MICC|nr:hypothetical protein [Galactobacter caseinivorans]RKW71649.1 hypothetical protein DWQ67_02080 [Galactobacter caseinivorans]